MAPRLSLRQGLAVTSRSIAAALRLELQRQSGNCIKEMMMKNAIILGLMLAMAAAFGTMAFADGPYVAAGADATATACAASTPVAGNQTTLLSASASTPPSVMVPKRLCAIVTNMSTSITA